VPTVSVCIPSYRQPAYFRRSLESVRAQSFEDYEVVVTDDSPDDAIAGVVRDLAAGDPRVRYVRNAVRKGSPENWNECARLARGRYVKFMHHDDWFARPDALRLLVDMMDRAPAADFGFCASNAWDAVTGEVVARPPTPEQVAALRRDPAALYAANFIGSPSETIYRSTVRATFDPRLKWVVDIDFYIRVLLANPRFAYCPEPLVTNTNAAAHQVTRDCEGDRRVETFEWLYLYAKLLRARRASMPQHRYVFDLLRKHRVRSAADLAALGVDLPVPPQISVLMALATWAPRGLLARLRGGWRATGISVPGGQ
jgi:glycosyltransferase involved in cell wall biosynthesis